MMRAAELPPAFAECEAIGVELTFHAFEGVGALSEEICLDAISAAVPGVDREKLRAIGRRTLDDQTFFGDWYDPVRATLIHRGNWTSDGHVLENPAVPDLNSWRMAGAVALPEPGTGGNFAYAFLQPPYDLGAPPKEVQRIFDEVKAYLLPPDCAHTILDWSDARLPEASAYFAQGMEWWGVFLFVIFVPDFQRLVVIVGSTTD